MSIQQGFHIADRCRVLLQENLACDGFDVGIRQSDADGEPVEEPSEQRHVGERALAGADNNHLAAKFLRNCFRDLAHKHRAIN